MSTDSEAQGPKTTFSVRIVTPLLCTKEPAPHYKGKGVLEVWPEGFTLTKKAMIGSNRSISLRWDQLRELRDDLVKKRRFSANFGATGDELVLTVKVLDGNVSVLSSLLAELPDCVHDLRCPACGGPVRQAVCTQCGKNPHLVNRKKGIYQILLGVLLAGPSAFIVLRLYGFGSNSSPGIIFVLGVAYGAVYALIGLVKVVFGVRW